MNRYGSSANTSSWKNWAPGAWGTVYKARHLQLDRLVTVKILAPALLADPQAIAWFRREMKAVNFTVDLHGGDLQTVWKDNVLKDNGIGKLEPIATDRL